MEASIHAYTPFLVGFVLCPEKWKEILAFFVLFIIYRNFSIVDMITFMKEDNKKIKAKNYIKLMLKQLSIFLVILPSLIRQRAREIFSESLESGWVVDHDNTMEIVYYIRDTKYRMCTPKKRGLRSILAFEKLPLEITKSEETVCKDEFSLNDIITRNNNDVTDTIREHLGPFGDFHRIPTTPRMLGYSEGLIVTYRKNNTVRTYQADDIISIEI